ncbi:uncharacterized protein LOC128015179 isoform X1 [Carassius gibelio]|uniref:uncharacterized protein LOC128015179 isoform X1 n=1 Tax=Carassius gibelio TaxID=101364 RepID=UPI00227928DB|nr:uncharacterized protein LOC128015179 isoform X1 [Carassius gibelio]
MLTALQCDVEQLQRSVLRLDAQIHSVLLENLELRNCTEEHQERRRSQQTEFSSHRSRMRDYRTAVCLQDSRAHLHQELQQKQQEASGLRHTLDELKTDLQKPDASAVRQTQVSLSLSLLRDSHADRITDLMCVLIPTEGHRPSPGQYPCSETDCAGEKSSSGEPTADTDTAEERDRDSGAQMRGHPEAAAQSAEESSVWTPSAAQ